MSILIIDQAETSFKSVGETPPFNGQVYNPGDNWLKMVQKSMTSFVGIGFKEHNFS